MDLAIEVVEIDEFKVLVEKAQNGEMPRAYIGFEPSGTAHIGWMVCSDMIERLYEAGFDVTILLADWHALINDKLGGDLHAIRRCAEYMTDAFEALGVDKERVTYRFAAEFAHDDNYWARVIQVAKHTSLARMRRAMTIMGRTEDEADADVSKFLYPAMQVADMFHLGVDLAYGGLDQRHAHMLARDFARKVGEKPPVALHTPLVPGLKAGAGRMDPFESKMSKSDPDSGIFIHDDNETVVRKVSGAHCPGGEVEGNPVLAMLQLIIWPRLQGNFVVERPEKFGGPIEFGSYAEVEAAFVAGKLHPQDLKVAVAAAVNRILEPVRAYFREHPENLRFVQALKRTK